MKKTPLSETRHTDVIRVREGMGALSVGAIGQLGLSVDSFIVQPSEVVSNHNP